VSQVPLTRGGGNENASEIGVSAKAARRKWREECSGLRTKKGRTESAFPGHQGRFGSAAQGYEIAGFGAWQTVCQTTGHPAGICRRERARSTHLGAWS